jgi:hypothetical protein
MSLRFQFGEVAFHCTFHRYVAISYACNGLRKFPKLQSHCSVGCSIQPLIIWMRGPLLPQFCISMQQVPQNSNTNQAIKSPRLIFHPLVEKGVLFWTFPRYGWLSSVGPETHFHIVLARMLRHFGHDFLLAIRPSMAKLEVLEMVNPFASLVLGLRFLNAAKFFVLPKFQLKVGRYR